MSKAILARTSFQNSTCHLWRTDWSNRPNRPNRTNGKRKHRVNKTIQLTSDSSCSSSPPSLLEPSVRPSPSNISSGSLALVVDWASTLLAGRSTGNSTGARLGLSLMISRMIVSSVSESSLFIATLTKGTVISPINTGGSYISITRNHSVCEPRSRRGTSNLKLSYKCGLRVLV